MKKIDKSELSLDEFAMYSQSKLKLTQAVEELINLLDYPPFGFDKTGKSSEINAEVMADINETLNNIDEEDFITDRYVPLAEIKKKYATEISQAKRLRDTHPSLGAAIKTWFDDNKLQLDESIAYQYGIG
jgi:hypothetical protein